MKKTTYLFLNLCRAAVKFVCFLAVFTAVNTLFLRFTEQFNEESRVLWSVAIMIFVIVSVSWVFYHFNKRAQTHFLESRVSTGNRHKKNSPIHALRSVDFWSDSLVCCTLSFVSPFLFHDADIQRVLGEYILKK